VMLTMVGRDFFPAIDGGQIKLHVRAPAATRIEATERIFDDVEAKIREVIPARHLELAVDDIGVPQRPYNLAFTDGSTINVNEGTILISLKEGHAPTADYVRRLRQVLPAAFPSVTFYFQDADMITQILNFGLPAQIDIQVVGRDHANNLRVAHELRGRLAGIPGIADAHLQQELDAPAFMVNIDRSRALQLGQRAIDRERRQYQPQFLGTGRDQFLDRPKSRDPLLHRGPDAGTAGEFELPRSFGPRLA
jgi:multidrug efflux pump subunit AcrB